MFVDYTISKFQEVTQLHIILLVFTIVLFWWSVVFLFLPYIRRVRSDSKKIAGMLSNLPAEVDVEGQVKAVVLNITKNENRASLKAATATMAASVVDIDKLGVMTPYVV